MTATVRRMAVFRAGVSFAVLAVISVGCGTGDDSVSGPVAHSCVETYSLKTLSRRAFAFDGTVRAIEIRTDPRLPDGEREVPWVTFDVHQWFRGGTRGGVGVWVENLNVATSTGVINAEPGTRLLVSGEPRWGGHPLEDPIAWPCGFTRPWSHEDADEWEAIFSDDAQAGSSNLERPPPVTVRFGDEAIELAAYTYCFGSVCADGFPREPIPDIGDPTEVIVEFPLSGWSFTAYFTPSGDECGRQQEVPLVSAEGGAFVLQPAGHAGTYDVTLFGDGDGDLFVTFRWTTPTDGPLPEPEARLAVLADHDGRVDSYGVELEVSNLARTPDDASATITVRSETGDAVTFDATLSNNRCLPEGTVYWDGPDDKGRAAAKLDGDTFTYKVELMLDSVRYVGIGTWPADEIVGNEPSVELHFTPDLPDVS